MEVSSTDQPAADEQEDGRQSNNHRRPPIPSFSLQGLDTGSAPPTSPSQSIGSRSRQEEDRLTQQEDEEDVDRHPDFTAADDEVDDDAAASISSSFSYDDTSDDDSSSSSDEDGNDIHQLSLKERMLRNQTRNAEFLRSLNEKYQEQIPAALKRSRASRKRKINTETKYDVEADRKPRGMLRKVQATTSLSKESNSRTLGERLRSLMAQYPHRESQIHHLAALLHGSVGACHTTPKGSLALQVPAPIFISGPPSTGKTSVVKDVVKALHNERLHSAYIHCETLEPSSVERLVSDAYRQLRATMDIQHHHSGWPKRRRLGSSSKKLPHSPMMPTKGNKILSPKSTSAAKVAAARKENAPANLAKLISDFDTAQDANPRLQPRRVVKEAIKPAQINLISSKSQKLRKLSKVKGKGSSIEQKSHHHDDEQVESSHSAVVAFGRSLQQHFGPGSGRSAVLILDHAERLLRLSARKKANEKSNCLAELLLLPKVMQLNLTIVLISQYSLLHHTRLDNLASAEKSTPSLLESTGGLTIQFPTYSSKDEFVQVLKSERILGRIIGRTPVTSLSKHVVDKVMDAFLTSLVQFLSDTTLDSNEFVRIGRSLWPVYIHPLQPSEITKTFNSLNTGAKEAGIPNEELDGEILAFLGRRLLGQFSKLSKDLTRLHLDSTGSLAGIPSRPCKLSELGLPFLQTCLLLAAFICQHNRAENDKKVFSVHGNGKRRKSRKGNEGQDDDIALASNGSAMEQLKSLRPRPFLVERVFSIFVTLVRLNPDAVPDIAGTKRPDFSIDSLGSARLYDDLRCLMDLGFIHEISHTGDVKAEKINVNAGKFWCSLTAEEASDLAASVGIPLDSYLV